MIQGSASLDDGNTQGARSTYKYFAPSLAASRRLFTELTSDSEAFNQFLVKGSKALGTIASRRNELADLTTNANQALGAIASQNEALDRSLVAFPPALRQADTTFVNLRAALDDLTPVVNATKPATKNLAPFLRKLRPVAQRSVPVLGNLRKSVNRPGPSNDLTDTLRDLPRVESKASKAVPQAITSFNASQPVIEFGRPYTPDLLGFISKFGQVSVLSTTRTAITRAFRPPHANWFHYCKPGDTQPICTGGGGPYTTGQLAPIPSSQQFNGLIFGIFIRLSRCGPSPSQAQSVHGRRQPALRWRGPESEVQYLRRSPWI